MTCKSIDGSQRRLGRFLAAVLASGDELLMSRKNCHAKNVSSIVVRNNGGRLTRAFLAWPGHELATNRLGCKFAVGIHDHKYDLALRAIYGVVRNTTYERQPGIDLTEWAFETGLATGRPVVRRVGTTSAVVASEEILGDDWTFLDSEVIHDIDCHGIAAWWVKEGELKKSSTTLLTMSRSVDADGLYSSFSSRDEVVSHVFDWAKLCWKEMSE